MRAKLLSYSPTVRWFPAEIANRIVDLMAQFSFGEKESEVWPAVEERSGQETTA